MTTFYTKCIDEAKAARTCADMRQILRGTDWDQGLSSKSKPQLQYLISELIREWETAIADGEDFELEDEIDEIDEMAMVDEISQEDRDKWAAEAAERNVEQMLESILNPRAILANQIPKYWEPLNGHEKTMAFVSLAEGRIPPALQIPFDIYHSHQLGSFPPKGDNLRRVCDAVMNLLQA